MYAMPVLCVKGMVKPGDKAGINGLISRTLIKL